MARTTLKDEAVRLDPARFVDCADLFREHASTILDRAATSADRLVLVQRLESAVGFLEQAAATCSGTALLSTRQTAWRTISGVLLRNYIKRSWTLAEVLSQSAGVMAAGAGLESANPGATARTVFAVERDTFRVDLAYILFWRNIMRREDCAKWTWQDASPQGAFNWLLTGYKWCRLRDIKQVVEAQMQLMSTAGGRCSSQRTMMISSHWLFPTKSWTSSGTSWLEFAAWHMVFAILSVGGSVLSHLHRSTMMLTSPLLRY